MKTVAMVIATVAIVGCSQKLTTVDQQARVERIASTMKIDMCVHVQPSLVDAKYNPATGCAEMSPKIAVYSDNTVAFIIAHEYGHKVLDHVAQERDAVYALQALYTRGQPVAVITPADMQQFRHGAEYAADQFAGNLVRQYNMYAIADIAKLLTGEETITHPAGKARVDLLTRM